MNPEFRRQLWLHISLNRLILMPVLLLTGALAVYFSAPHDAAAVLSIASATIFLLLVCAVGTSAAGASVLDEMNERTWDQQRMSAMQPWAMTWGKLAGSTAYAWYGAAICLAVGVPSVLLTDPRADVWVSVAAGILFGLLFQSLILAVNLQLAKVGGHVAKRGGFLGLFLLALWVFGASTALLEQESGVWWWHRTYSAIGFILLSLTLFTTCAVVAAWRSMAEMLAVRQWPWGWPLLVVMSTVFFAGLGASPTLTGVASIGLVISAAMTYFALLTEPQTRPMWQRVVSAAATRRWRAALQQLPRWPTTLVLVFVFAVMFMFSSQGKGGAVGHWHIDFAQQAISFALLVLRDGALALFFAFSIKGRRPTLAFGVLMLVLYALLPWMVSSLGSPVALGLVFPLAAFDSNWAVLAAGLHAAVACALLYWRWQQSRP